MNFQTGENIHKALRSTALLSPRSAYLLVLSTASSLFVSFSFFFVYGVTRCTVAVKIEQAVFFAKSQ
jgi:hypothetical protein